MLLGGVVVLGWVGGGGGAGLSGWCWVEEEGAKGGLCGEYLGRYRSV